MEYFEKQQRKVLFNFLIFMIVSYELNVRFKIVSDLCDTIEHLKLLHIKLKLTEQRNFNSLRQAYVTSLRASRAIFKFSNNLRL